jgi:hypothetical protein
LCEIENGSDAAFQLDDGFPAPTSRIHDHPLNEGAEDLAGGGSLSRRSR